MDQLVWEEESKKDLSKGNNTRKKERIEKTCQDLKVACKCLVWNPEPEFQAAL